MGLPVREELRRRRAAQAQHDANMQGAHVAGTWLDAFLPVAQCEQRQSVTQQARHGSDGQGRTQALWKLPEA
jgi:hypothetical protein